MRARLRALDLGLRRGAAGLTPEAMRRPLDRAREQLDARATRLAPAAARRLREALQAVAALGRTLATLDPHHVLERGFAIVRDGDGQVVTDAAAAARSPLLELEFADGRLRARPERRSPAPRGGPEDSQGKLL
jgi:exodeoxyribonuclease VII large subunit